ncbi:MAG: amidohydrolase family protein [Bacteroidia bacterium]
MLKIDTHTHILPEHLPRFSEKFGYGDFIQLQHHRPGYANMMKGDVFFREIKANCWDPKIRIREYANHRTQVQVVSTIPVMFSYWAKPQDTLDLSRFLNDHLAEVVAAFPRQYVGLATLPMQDADLAVAELQRCKEELHLPGIQIGSNINNLNLSEPQFWPIWEACEQLGMCILVHPWEMMGRQYMEKYWLPWLVGMPAETTRAACSMIFGGVFERYPDLRVCFAHAGGSLLATIGRIEHGFRCRPDLVAIDNPVNPREYLGHFWVDSITHDANLLRFVLNSVGSNRVVIGSDYPFPLGDLEIGAFIDEMGLPPFDKENIYYRSALEWLGLDARLFA